MKPLFLFWYLKLWTYWNNIFAFISARFTIKLTEQKWNKFIKNSDTLIFIWMLVFPIGIIQVTTPRKWIFLLYFSSLHDYWPPTTLISLVHNSLGEMKWCEKRAIQLLKMRKMKGRWNIKSKCVTDLLLTVRSSSMNDYTCHYAVSK